MRKIDFVGFNQRTVQYTFVFISQSVMWYKEMIAYTYCNITTRLSGFLEAFTGKC